MTIFARCFRECLLRLAMPTVVCTALAIWIARSLDELGAPDIEASSAWLHLPGLVLSAVALAAVTAAWPAFGRRRTGSAFVVRLRTGPLDGCGAAAFAAWCALAIALAAAGAAFDRLAPSAHDGVERRLEARLEATAELVRPGDRVRATLAGNPTLGALRLSPRARYSVDGDYAPVDVDVFVDDETAAIARTTLRGLGESTTLRVAPRQVRSITLQRVSAPGPALRFGSVGVVGIGDTPLPRTWNAVLACASYLLPAAIALSIACAGRARLGLLVLALSTGAVLLTATASGMTPPLDAIRTYAHGAWLPDAGLGAACFWSLSSALAVMLCSVWTGGHRSV